MEFTNCCVQGRSEAASQFVLPGQQQAFNRWFEHSLGALLADSPRKKRAPQLKIRFLERTSQRAFVRTIISSPEIGTVVQSQRWRHARNRWRFDAQETLKGWGDSDERVEASPVDHDRIPRLVTSYDVKDDAWEGIGYFLKNSFASW